MPQYVTVVQMEIHLKYKFFQKLHQDNTLDTVFWLGMEKMAAQHHLFIPEMQFKIYYNIIIKLRAIR